MPCYHPLKGFVLGYDTTTNKKKIMVTSNKIDHLEWSYRNNKYEKIESKECKVSDVLYPSYDIPCGHCIGCRLQYSRDWANRILLELKEHSDNYFITLTYNDDYLPRSVGTIPDTGEVVESATLVKEHWQKFMKRLRRAYADKYPEAERLRFFACGEYGDKSFRPHYHAIIFGLKLNDLKWYKRSGDFDLYTSEWLSDIWTDPDKKKDDKTRFYGFVVVGKACWETAAYCARYVTKKLNGKEADKYEMLGIIPEFALMSRKPGIAANYMDQHYGDFLDDKFIYVSTPDGGKKFMPPKYFKRKFDAFFEDQDGVSYSWWKYHNEQASSRLMESIKQLQGDQTDLSYLDMLSVQEAVQKAKIKGLERSL